MLSKRLPIFLILLIAGFLRFYNLMHDAPFFFNPDERNMAGAITRLRLPGNIVQIPSCVIDEFNPFKSDNRQLKTENCNLNPHFFAYGQFPLYLAFTSDQILSGLLQTQFPSAIFYLRFWSALFSTLTVYLVFLISRRLFNYQLSIITSLLAAFTPGLIQSAHFGTTESLLTFFFLASIYLSIQLLNSKHEARNWISDFGFRILALSIVIGLALGSKLTGIFFFIPPFLALGTKVLQEKKQKNKFVYCLIGLLVLIGSISFFILSSPYNLKEPDNFLSAVFGYEKDVAMGAFEAFYTRQFVETTPILFQAEKIFPYVLGWPVFILGTLGFLIMSLKQIIQITLMVHKKYQISSRTVRDKYQKHILKIKNFEIFNFASVSFIFYFSFLIYFLPNVFLFAKWTRFMTPILPFFSIFAGYALFIFLSSRPKWRDLSLKDSSTSLRYARNDKINLLSYLFIGLLIFISFIPGIAFMSIYTNRDSRVVASKWIYQNIPDNSYILSETANVVDIPLGIPSYNLQPTTYNLNVISFDFYHLDENPILFQQLLTHLEKADYILIPSRRIFANYTRLSQRYPRVSKYYELLFSGKLGFEKVAETTSFPSLILESPGRWPDFVLEFPDEQSEETFTVFDHPVIRIYKKTKPLTIDQYRLLFNKSI